MKENKPLWKKNIVKYRIQFLFRTWIQLLTIFLFDNKGESETRPWRNERTRQQRLGQYEASQQKTMKESNALNKNWN